MKANRAGNYDLRKFFQRAVYFDRVAALHRAGADQLRAVVCVVIQRANALRDERGQQLDFFFRPDCAMNAGREENGDVA